MIHQKDVTPMMSMSTIKNDMRLATIMLQGLRLILARVYISVSLGLLTAVSLLLLMQMGTVFGLLRMLHTVTPQQRSRELMAKCQECQAKLQEWPAQVIPWNTSL